MSHDLRRIGLRRAMLIVFMFALLAFAGWSASGAQIRPASHADVTVRAVNAPKPATDAPQPTRRAHRTTRARPPAENGPTNAPRTHVCRGLDGKRHRQDAQIPCLKRKNPADKLLERLRRHRPTAPTAPPAGAQPQPGQSDTTAGSEQPQPNNTPDPRQPPQKDTTENQGPPSPPNPSGNSGTPEH
jgi:hypothetical protein